jgi:ribosome-binding protein aMBF1 (putative translation factor)
MKADRVKRLQADGWQVGSAAEFLQLSDEEIRLIDLKVSLSGAVRKSRIKRKLSQVDLAKRMKSSQSRIAKIEAGDPSVSLDLIVRALIASGATARDIQSAFATKAYAKN